MLPPLKNKGEIVPDLCVYQQSPPLVDDPGEDEVRVTTMPELAIEVLSPTQSINELLKKIKAYFALGVKSCWLVMPCGCSRNSYNTIRISISTIAN